MNGVISLAEAGISVTNSELGPEVAAEFQKEWLYELDEHQPLRTHSRRAFETPFTLLSIMTNYSRFPATNRVVDLLSVPLDPNMYIQINFQPPGGAQRMHLDIPEMEGEATIFHAGDHGAFDFAPEAHTRRQARSDHESIEGLNAGDVLRFRNQSMYHGGRNMDPENARITGAIYRVRAGYQPKVSFVDKVKLHLP